MEFNIRSSSEKAQPVKVESKEASLSEEKNKFVVLMFRKYTDLEWETFEKWSLKVYEYTRTSAGDQTIPELLEKYDVVLIDMYSDETFQFWSLAQGSFSAHICSLVDKRRSCSDVDRFGIQSQLKEFLDVKNSAEFLKYLRIGNPKKPRSWKAELAVKIVEGVVGVCIPLAKKQL